ncbi:hypothetical protein ACROYT_G014430 [Oculina patagonica]
MKEKMLLPVRRSAGLEDNFYYNNCRKSMNSCMKKEIDHQKKAASPGKSSKCLYAEFSDITDKFVGKYRRNVHKAIVGDSPYTLAPSYKHLEVSKEDWDQLSKTERISRIALIDECGAKEYEEDLSSSAPSISQILPDFDCSGLPKTLEETWSKADQILQKYIMQVEFYYSIGEGDTVDRAGGGLESHPRLTGTVLYQAADSNTVMRQARENSLALAPEGFSISLSLCFNYTQNYREGTYQANRHHSEAPASPLVKMWLVRLARLLRLKSVTQKSFAEYHSKRNPVEFSSTGVYDKYNIGDTRHHKNMQHMAEKVKQSILHTKYGGNPQTVQRGIGEEENFVLNDDEELDSFLRKSKLRKDEESKGLIQEGYTTMRLSKVLQQLLEVNRQPFILSHIAGMSRKLDLCLNSSRRVYKPLGDYRSRITHPVWLVCQPTGVILPDEEGSIRAFQRSMQWIQDLVLKNLHHIAHLHMMKEKRE